MRTPLLALLGLLFSPPFQDKDKDREPLLLTRTLLSRLPAGVVEGQFEISPEGRGAAMILLPGRTKIQVGDKESKEYSSITRLAVLADGRPLFSAAKGRNFVVVAGEEEGIESDSAMDFIVGPGGRRFAYGVYVPGGRRQVVVDQKGGDLYKSVGLPVFSPDGSRVAYSAEKGPRRFVMVVDGREGPEFSYVGSPVFSP